MNRIPSDDGFEGGLLGEALHGGRLRVQLVCTATCLRATAADGTTFELPYSSMALEMGGASGRMLFCRGGHRKLTYFCEEKGFVGALRESSRGLLTDQIDALVAVRNRNRRRALIWVAIALAVVAGLVMGARPLLRWTVSTFMPFSVDEQIGKAVFASMAKPGTVVENKTVAEAIDRIVDRLEPHALLPDVEFHVEVVKNDLINAYALPGGSIVIFTGLIKNSGSAEEVAGVLAHEMAHVTLRHGMQMLAQSGAITIGVAALFGDVSGLTAAALELFTWQTMNNYSRGSENEADAEGFRMLQAAAIDPQGLPEFLLRLNKEVGDVPAALSWISTHPRIEDRVEAIKNQMASAEGIEYKKLDIDWDTVKTSLE